MYQKANNAEKCIKKRILDTSRQQIFSQSPLNLIFLMLNAVIE